MARFTGNGDGPLDPDSTARLFIDGYGNGGFRIAGRHYGGSVLILPGHVLPWPVGAIGEATADSLAALFEAPGETELLLLGGGARMQPVPGGLRAACRAAGIVVEPMDTGAAARTYNVLLAEGRLVSAALVAV